MIPQLGLLRIAVITLLGHAAGAAPLPSDEFAAELDRCQAIVDVVATTRVSERGKQVVGELVLRHQERLRQSRSDASGPEREVEPPRLRPSDLARELDRRELKEDADLVGLMFLSKRYAFRIRLGALRQWGQTSALSDSAKKILHGVEKDWDGLWRELPSDDAPLTAEQVARVRAALAKWIEHARALDAPEQELLTDTLQRRIDAALLQ